MDREDWDERYRTTELLWSGGPNQFVVDEVADLPPGTALDLACGEGRNALWLAEQGWTVTGTDFSPVAIERARRIAEDRGIDLDLRIADATTPVADGPYDLVLVAYLHLPPDARRAAHRHAAAAVAPGGTLLVVGHDVDNLTDGAGGPGDPAVLLTTERVTGDLEGSGLTIESSRQVTRDVETDDGTAVAIDTLVRATRPAG
jgi:SAM-dependent methyltransferase